MNIERILKRTTAAYDIVITESSFDGHVDVVVTCGGKKRITDLLMDAIPEQMICGEIIQYAVEFLDDDPLSNWISVQKGLPPNYDSLIEVIAREDRRTAAQYGISLSVARAHSKAA